VTSSPGITQPSINTTGNRLFTAQPTSSAGTKFGVRESTDFEAASELDVAVRDGVATAGTGTQARPVTDHTRTTTSCFGGARVVSQDLGRVIETDPAISATVLQMVNSAFFCKMRRMVSIPEAVRYLGLDLLKALLGEPLS
jgi:HDOD domain